ncbi:hypothetical protein [Mesorhizobium loti]|uniref:hypothetical protein n=1 Tax=Rhizobium loti TaxID=381 RepID=UPI0007EF995D|nr:hypothetical protein [Mesorhizobium loti]
MRTVSPAIGGSSAPLRGTGGCSFGSLGIDLAVGAQVIKLLQPLGAEAALQLIETRRAAQLRNICQEQTDLKAKTFQGQVMPLVRSSGPVPILFGLPTFLSNFGQMKLWGCSSGGASSLQKQCDCIALSTGAALASDSLGSEKTL